MGFYVASILQNPSEPTKKMPIFWSKQGGGKTVLWENLEKYIFGQHRHIKITSNPKELVGNFCYLDSYVVVVLEESAIKDMQVLRQRTTSTSASVEHKFQAPVDTFMFCNYAVCLNDTFTLEQGDRRYFVCYAHPRACQMNLEDDPARLPHYQRNSLAWERSGTLFGCWLMDLPLKQQSITLASVPHGVYNLQYAMLRYQNFSALMKSFYHQLLTGCNWTDAVSGNNEWDVRVRVSSYKNFLRDSLARSLSDDAVIHALSPFGIIPDNTNGGVYLHFPDYPTCVRNFLRIEPCFSDGYGGLVDVNKFSKPEDIPFPSSEQYTSDFFTCFFYDN